MLSFVDSVCGLKIVLPLLSMMSQKPGDAGGGSVRNKVALATSEVAAQSDKSTAQRDPNVTG
jgi:hypothetical protein